MSDKSTDQASVTDQSSASGSDAKTKDTVSYETYQELLGQRKKDQEKLKALEAKFKEIEGKDAADREKKLKDEGNFKALLEDREKELAALREQNVELTKSVQTFEETIASTKKFNAFNRAIGGRLKSEEYYKFVDTSKIALDPETGKVDESSVKSYAQTFVEKHKELVDSAGARLPDQAPRKTSFDLDTLKSKDDIKEAMKVALGKK
jgi:hypothetical protein